MILVTGATGKTGRELVRLLTTSGARFRVLARNADKARDRLGAGVEIVTGDLGRPESLEPAMRGIERVFLLSSPDPGSPALQRNAIEAAKKAGVSYLVKMSAVDASTTSKSRFLRLHGEMDEALEKCGLTYTRLRPHSFMQNTLEFAPTISTQGVFYTPPSAAVPVVDVRDIAAVACSVLLENGH
ncbi:MAG TPA: NAD(P)H-binding protein, partial [Candidatus Eisenbacteria bacterium]|nr:NAD(P)H-binding protein [Candidatus Eisenbacteria bacterium]